MPRTAPPVRALALVTLCGSVLAGCAPASLGTDAAETVAAPLGLPLVDGVTVQEGLVYAAPDGAELALDACLPATRASEARPAIIFVHGGSWYRGARDEPLYRETCEWLAGAGYPTFSISYRLSPAAQFPTATDDVRAALAWLREPEQVAAYGIDPDRIALFGSSAGGTLAAWVGTAGEGAWSAPDRVAAVVELSAPIDLSGVAEDARLTQRRLDYLGCETDDDCEAAALASPITAIDASDPPVFIVHSEDEFVPDEQGELFAAALREAGGEVEFVVVPGDRHAIMLLDADISARILDFLARTVGGEAILAAD